MVKAWCFLYIFLKNGICNGNGIVPDYRYAQKSWVFPITQKEENKTNEET